VKIKGFDKRNQRAFMVEQVIESGGASPWDGQPFSPDYALILVNALRTAEQSGSRLQQALEQVAAIHPDFTLDEASIIGPLKTQIDQLNQNLVRQG
jgi:hypothetical protein